MLSLRALGNLGNNGAAARAVSNYFKDNYSDYYVKGLDENYVGEWTGNGAQRLNLEGSVNREAVQQALSGLINGKSVQNAGHPKRQMGWDLTFSAPKSASVVWAFADDNHRKEIEEAHKGAAQMAFHYLQRKVTTRRGKGGHIKETAQICAAHFSHFTSREGDPQMHSHFVVPNFSIRNDGTVGTIESRVFYTHKMAAGALYQLGFARDMRKLGYEVEKGKKGTFRLETVSADIERNFSKRGAIIDLTAEEQGIRYYSGTRGVAVATRPNKTYTSLEEREKIWNNEIEKLGFNVDFQRSDKEIKLNKINHGERMEEIGSELTENNSTFVEKDIIRQMAITYMGEASIRDVGIIYDVFTESRKVVMLGQNDSGGIVYTTREMLEIEKDILKLTDKLVEQEHRSVNPKKAIKRRPFLSDEQINSINTACSDSGLVVIQGRAGTGKTTLLDALHESYQHSFIKVNGIALTGHAAQQMQKESNIKSQTAHSWLNQEKYHNNSVLVIDEAGMIGSRMMQGIFQTAYENNMKVIMIGDERQLQPINAGGPLHMVDEYLKIQHHENSSQINAIKRQKEGWMREAVKSASFGITKESLKSMAEHGKINIYHNAKDARGKLINEFLDKNINQQNDAVILTHRKHDAYRINKEVREKLKEKGLIDEKGTVVDNGRQNIELAKGDRVMFTKNDYAMDVRNGQRGTVQRVWGRPNTVMVGLDNGTNKLVSINEYHNLDYGWASTTHKAQGMTVGRAYVFGYSQEPMASRQSTYVQISRAREETKIYVVSGEASLELGVQEHEKQFDFTEKMETLNKMHKTWSRDASKYTAVETLKRFGRDIKRERLHDNEMDGLSL